MATTATLPISLRTAEDLAPSDLAPNLELGFACGLVTILTAFALAIHGYHPYAEDGGLYMAEIKRLLDPSLYPHGTEFVTGHLGASAFAPMVVSLIRESHMSLGVVLFLLHLVSFWGTLFAGWLLAARCYASRRARTGAVALLATWITLPIAGTSLMLMDPYLTARSISTPCVLLALVGTLDVFLPEQRESRLRGLILCGVALAMATAMHPLMAAYGIGCVLVLGCVTFPMKQVRVWGTAALCGTAFGVAAILQAVAPAESASYLRVVMTRYYWFPGGWHGYEQFGLAAPLIILAFIGFRTRHEGDAARVALARMAFVCGTVAVVVAALFARAELATHMVARLQPLRIFQVVYVLMILAVGAALAEYVLQRRPLRWVTAFVLLTSVMVVAERRTFPGSAHLELPWRTPQNQWEQAFLWISRNTPKGDLFALDAHYITSPGEDAQCFRAIAERSVLPDYSKDGGEASITPELTSSWMAGETAQTKLNLKSDAERVASLKPLGVTWVILEQGAKTEFACAYANGTVKVCRLP